MVMVYQVLSLAKSLFYSSLVESSRVENQNNRGFCNVFFQPVNIFQAIHINPDVEAR
jgi:hypothetical protein